MKKILMSIIAMVVTVGAVSTAAFALFSDTASLTGITFATGNADLQISLNGTTFVEGELPVVDLFQFEGLVPGATAPVQSFWLRNASSGVDMDLAAQMTLPDPTGNPLADTVEVAITEVGSLNAPIWRPLSAWYSGDVGPTPWAIGDSALIQGSDRQFNFWVRMVESATESGTLTGVTWTFTGTQVAP